MSAFECFVVAALLNIAVECAAADGVLTTSGQVRLLINDVAKFVFIVVGIWKLVWP